jgi:hypothetical protein
MLVLTQRAKNQAGPWELFVYLQGRNIQAYFSSGLKKTEALGSLSVGSFCTVFKFRSKFKGIFLAQSCTKLFGWAGIAQS